MKKLIHIKSDLQRKTLSELIPEIPDNHFVKIMPETGIRRLELNDYYWAGLITPMAEHYGYTKDQMHHKMKKIHLYPMMLSTDDDFADLVAAVRNVYKQGLHAQAQYMIEFVYKKLTTTILSNKQFTEYAEQVKRFAMDENIKLPTKEEYEGSHSTK